MTQEEKKLVEIRNQELKIKSNLKSAKIVLDEK